MIEFIIGVIVGVVLGYIGRHRIEALIDSYNMIRFMLNRKLGNDRPSVG